MEGERWAAVESLYQAALEKPPGERSSWLSEACAHDDSLQVEVEALLARADASLSNPAARREMAKLWHLLATVPAASYLVTSVAERASTSMTLTRPSHCRTVYALETKLDLPANTTRADLLKAMDGHVIGKAAWFGRFHTPAQ